MSANRRSLADEVTALRGLVEEIRAGAPRGSVWDRLEVAYDAALEARREYDQAAPDERARLSLTLIEGGRDA
jgi:hypothetical protein